MEALVAVGLAGNVVQFVQFSGQLVSLAKEIKRKGAPSSLLDLRKVAQDLAQRTRVIVTRLKANAATLEQEEQHLLDVATDCEKAGEEFVAYIDGLIKTSKPSSRFGSVQSSVKIKWRHDQIEAYLSRLDRLQGSLLLATMLSLRTMENGSHQEILGHLRSIETGKDLSQQSENHLIRVISLLQDVVQQRSGPKLDMLQNQMDSCMKDIQKIRSSFTNTREKEIIRWLDFRQRTWRFEEVEEAHQTTFEWIFREPHANTLWDDFGSYLSGGTTSSPYFINGKAGSGKSTLMKYIISHPETKKRLERWAGQHKLFSPHFFFWNIGTQLQKSHTGLLRSLLHSVLVQYPDLVPAVFPTLYTNGIPVSDDEDPSYIELKTAFERMKARSASFLRICIFIDGVDEFDGDHRDMSMFLCSLASSTIKVVVSSRPINACLNVFRGCPTLRLQDLTQGDMRVFIQDRLSSHPMMAELEDESPEKAAALKAEIQEKAEGVFLWVRLVTGLLLRGLEDGDDFDDLIPKLQALPTDLRGLYTRMMEKMPTEYQAQASKMFQISEWWRLSGIDEPLELLLLSSATQPPSIAISSSTNAWDQKKTKGCIGRMASQVRSRCCGLLEVRDILIRSIFWPPTPVVAYLHRSVVEFLADPEIWGHVLSLTQEPSFSAGTHIAGGILSILKASHSPPKVRRLLREPRISRRTEYSEGILDLVVFVCRRNVDVEDAFILQYMDALDKVMALAHPGLRPRKAYHPDLLFSALSFNQMNPSCSESEIHHSTNQMLLSDKMSILGFAAHSGIVSYLQAVDRILELTDVESLILFALSSWVRRQPVFPGQLDTLEFLLRILSQHSELGIETQIGERTLWEHAVSVVYDISDKLHLESSPIDTSNLDDPWPRSDRDENLTGYYHLYWAKLGRDTPLELHLTDRTLVGNEVLLARDRQRKRKLEEQALETIETDSTRDKRQKWEDMVSRLQEPNDAVFGVPEARSVPPEYPALPLANELPVSLCNESDSQKAVDILRLFLSVTNKGTGLLNKTMSAPKGPIFTPFAILRNILLQAHGEEMGWASKSEYQFLYQLIGL